MAERRVGGQGALGGVYSRLAVAKREAFSFQLWPRLAAGLFVWWSRSCSAVTTVGATLRGRPTYVPLRAAPWETPANASITDN